MYIYTYTNTFICVYTYIYIYIYIGKIAGDQGIHQRSCQRALLEAP
jgi:hypothetical protein